MTASSTKSKKSKGADKGKSKSGSANPNAIELLKTDHREVEALFRKYEKSNSSEEKIQLSEQICLALKIHTQIEEEIFYPAARDEISDESLVDEAMVEHASAKKLIEEIEASDVSDELYDAKLKVLSELIESHVEDEEKELFPKARKARLDMEELGITLASRKDELMADISPQDD